MVENQHSDNDFDKVELSRSSVRTVKGQQDKSIIVLAKEEIKFANEE